MRASSRACGALAVLCVALAGCGQSILVGKWSTPSGETLEVLGNGALILQKGPDSIAGHWEALDANRVSLKFDNFGGESVVCVFRGDGSDLIFNDCKLAGRLLHVS